MEKFKNRGPTLGQDFMGKEMYTYCLLKKPRTHDAEPHRHCFPGLCMANPALFSFANIIAQVVRRKLIPGTLPINLLR